MKFKTKTLLSVASFFCFSSLSGCASLAEIARTLDENPARKSQSHQRNVAEKSNRKRRVLTSLQFQLIRISDSTYRSHLPPLLVYNMVAKQLSKNYILSSADRKNLSITTDWDKFFIEDRLFRNRMSVTVFPVANRMTEVVIKNNVEYFSGQVHDSSTDNSWLPSPDVTDEVQRLVSNTNRLAVQYAVNR